MNPNSDNEPRCYLETIGGQRKKPSRLKRAFRKTCSVLPDNDTVLGVTLFAWVISACTHLPWWVAVSPFAIASIVFVIHFILAMTVNANIDNDDTPS